MFGASLLDMLTGSRRMSKMVSTYDDKNQLFFTCYASTRRIEPPFILFVFSIFVLLDCFHQNIHCTYWVVLISVIGSNSEMYLLGHSFPFSCCNRHIIKS
eukprot:TRINITY_DN6389_c0_g1_i5.p1 TRINITY_DN6389_c0_g1~~TRINITY_DN6389_c0_g1_i5.p1  ORF type:complete len:100 (-),score=5.64 TRINITY_DN6389_c0_g1_i5:3-302(-)